MAKKFLKKTWKPSKQGKEAFLGVYAPQYISDYLTLLALVKETSVSQVMRNIFSEYYSDTVMVELQLCRKLSLRLQKNWMDIRRQAKLDNQDLDVEFTEFIETVTKELQQSKLKPEHITEILNGISKHNRK